jgi:hypothetical protein
LATRCISATRSKNRRPTTLLVTPLFCNSSGTENSPITKLLSKMADFSGTRSRRTKATSAARVVNLQTRPKNLMTRDTSSGSELAAGQIIRGTHPAFRR